MLFLAADLAHTVNINAVNFPGLDLPHHFMMRQVKAGEIDCIYVYRMRQISGKEQHLFRFFQQVMQHGIKVVTLEYSLRDRLHEYRLGMKIENYAARHKLPFPW